MPQSTQMEQGHLYKAEHPSGESKGVAIGGKVTAKKGSPVQVGDGSTAKIRKEWGEAENASGKFPPV